MDHWYVYRPGVESEMRAGIARSRIPADHVLHAHPYGQECSYRCELTPHLTSASVTPDKGDALTETTEE